jgi:hypothetical protein
MMEKDLIYSVLIATLLPGGLTAQVSEYTDCSDIYHDSQESIAPLTAEEEAALLDDTYYVKIADLTKCEKQASSGGGPAGGGGQAGGGTAGSESAASGSDVGGSAGRMTESISKNERLLEEQAIAVTNTKFPEAASDTDLTVGYPFTASSPDGAGNGRDHEDLNAADNRAALMAQIKAQADAETDPEIKKRLMEQYEALK